MADLIGKRIKDNSKRKFPGEHGPRPDLAAVKREEATTRRLLWEQLSPAEQLRALDMRLGKGIGAKKQRARIAAKMGRKAA